MSCQLSPAVQEQVERGIALLRQEGIVAFPTDTVYGLGADISSHRAVERVYEVKRRPRHMALPLLLASVAQIADVVREVPPAAWPLINCFLPGALTLVLPASVSVPDIVTAGGGGVAVRIPAHPVPLALIRGVSAPLVGTSANVSGQPSPLTGGEVREQLGDAVDLIIDNGQRCPGRESTIVDVTGEVPVVLREGAIPIEALRRVAGHITAKEGG